jgi:hypothetical protein
LTSCLLVLGQELAFWHTADPREVAFVNHWSTKLSLRLHHEFHFWMTAPTSLQLRRGCDREGLHLGRAVVLSSAPFLATGEGASPLFLAHFDIVIIGLRRLVRFPIIQCMHRCSTFFCENMQTREQHFFRNGPILKSWRYIFVPPSSEIVWRTSFLKVFAKIYGRWRSNGSNRSIESIFFQQDELLKLRHMLYIFVAWRSMTAPPSSHIVRRFF